MIKNSRKKMNIKKIKVIKKLLLILLILLVVIEAMVLLVVNRVGKDLESKTPSELSAYASSIISKCGNSPYKPTCYDKEIPKLMDKISMTDAFEVIKLVQIEDEDYKYCHVVGHKLSGRETKKDPSKWKDVITRCPTTMCNNGCLHGPLLEVFNSESLTKEQIKKIIPEVKMICEPRGDWHPLEVERSMCYHAIGHLNMYMTKANLKKSANLCREVSIKEDGRSYEQTCIQGVFMQIYQPLEPEDYALIKGLTPQKGDVRDFCNKFTGLDRGACFRESWPLFRNEVMIPEGATKFCSYSDDIIENRRCFSSLMSVVTVNYIIDKKDINNLYNFCTKIPKEQSERCFGDAARRMVQIDPGFTTKAIEICELAKKANYDKQCYGDLLKFGTEGLKPNSKEFKILCDALPDLLNKECAN